jgi:hypothetical protein
MVADHQGGRHQRPVALIGLAAGKVCVVAHGDDCLTRPGDWDVGVNEVPKLVR